MCGLCSSLTLARYVIRRYHYKAPVRPVRYVALARDGLSVVHRRFLGPSGGPIPSDPRKPQCRVRGRVASVVLHVHRIRRLDDVVRRMSRRCHGDSQMCLSLYYLSVVVIHDQKKMNMYGQTKNPNINPTTATTMRYGIFLNRVSKSTQNAILSRICRTLCIALHPHLPEDHADEEKQPNDQNPFCDLLDHENNQWALPTFNPVNEQPDFVDTNGSR